MDHRPSSFDSIISEIQNLTDEELSQWIIRALDKRSSGKKHLPTRGERHTLIEALYKKSDRLLQIKLGSALARVLQSLEPKASSDKDESEFLFSLLSLASLIRNEQIKERLRRWLYQGAFHEWKHEIFNLYGVLILTTSAYDSDETWLNHILQVLPTRTYFKDVALESYRAILQTKGIECVELLPDILNVVKPEDENSRKRFGYLLEETIDKYGQEFFFTRVTKSLSGEERDIAKVLSNVLKFEEFFEEAFQDYPQKQFNKWIKNLDEMIWKPATEKWQSMEDEENKNAFVRILKECEQYMTHVPDSFVRGTNKVLVFRGTHEIVISREQENISQYFEDLDKYDAAQDPVAELAQAVPA